MTRPELPTSPIEAYDRSATAWATGADPAYRRFAEALLARAPSTWIGARVLDVAAGAGPLSLALRELGAEPVALDGAPSMLAVARARVPGLPVLAGDALALPLATSSLDGAAIGFCLNHVPEPWLLLAEAARVVRAGGVVLASTFERGVDHRAKDAVDDAARAQGWQPSDWYVEFHDHARHSDTAALLSECALRAGLLDVSVTATDVDTGLATSPALVAWRLGMPELAAFARSLDVESRATLVAAAVTALGPKPEPLVRRVLALVGRSPS